MSKTEVLRKYEMVVIVDARLTNEEKDGLLKGLSETVVKAGGKVTSSAIWIERQKMTVKIKKCLEGTYFMVTFEGDSTVVNQAKAVLRLNEKLLRLLIINVE